MTDRDNLTPENQAQAAVKCMQALEKAGWSNQLQSTIDDVFLLFQSLGYVSAVTGDRLLNLAPEEPEMAADLLMLKQRLDNSLAHTATALESLRVVRAAQAEPLNMPAMFAALLSDQDFEETALKFFRFFCADLDRAEAVEQLNRLLNNDATEEAP